MDSSNCYFSDIGDTFGFGRHRNQLLCDVIADDPTYLIWCVNNICNFGISERALEQIKQLFPDFPITDVIMQHVRDEYEFQDSSDFIDDSDWQEWDEEPATYERWRFLCTR